MGRGARLFRRRAQGRGDSDAHLGLADAYWWLCDGRASVRHRERAWSLLRQAGDVVAAGRVAIDLCIAHLVNLGNDVAARGWIARAERILGDLDPNPLKGWLWLMHGYMAADPTESHRLVEDALVFTRQVGDIDLELVALSDLGLAEVAAGNVTEGTALLDEAMAATVAGEYRRLDTVVFATCSMLAACHVCGDLDRTTKWCRAADDFMAAFGCPFLYARCRVHYGGVLVASGRWEQAEQQLEAAVDMSIDAGPGVRNDAVAQLADLRLRQGRIEDAEALLDQIDQTATRHWPRPRCAWPRASPMWRPVSWSAARKGSATSTSKRHRRWVCWSRRSSRTDRSRTLPQRRRGWPRSRSSRVATRHAHRRGSPRRASQSQRAGATMLVAALEQALVTFESSNLPLDEARARLELAGLLADTNRALAVAEAQQALIAFERLGAAADVDAASAALRSLGASGRTFVRTGGVLTERESEVLQLVAIGLSNPEIAERLYISRKTASNHVSAILTKLGLRNRAEAVAYASRQPVRREGSTRALR